MLMLLLLLLLLLQQQDGQCQLPRWLNTGQHMPGHGPTLLKTCMPVRNSWTIGLVSPADTASASASTIAPAGATASAVAATAFPAAGGPTHVLGSLQRSMYIMFLL
jgi:hypothetical protein